MGLPGQRRDARGVRRRHRRTGDRRRTVAGAAAGRDDAHARSRDVRLQAAVTSPRTAGREVREALEVGVREPPWPRCWRCVAVRRAELAAVGRGRGRETLDPEERDRDVVDLARVRVAGDLALERGQGRGVVDHDHGDGSGLLAEDRARDAGAGAAVHDRDLARCAVRSRRRRSRGTRLRASPGCSVMHRDLARERPAERVAVRVHRVHRHTVRQRDPGARELRRRVVGRRRERAVGGAGRAGDVLVRAAVAGRGDDDHAGLRRVRRGNGRRVVGGAERASRATC